MPSYLVNSPFWTLILSGQLHSFAESNLANDNDILYRYERLGSFPFNNAIALSSIVFTSSALGDVPTVHVIGIPSKQSMIGDKYTFPSPLASVPVPGKNFFLLS